MNITTIIISYVVAQGNTKDEYARALMGVIYTLLWDSHIDGAKLDIDMVLLREDYEYITKHDLVVEAHVDSFINYYIHELHDVETKVIKDFANAFQSYGKLGVVKWLYETYGAELATYIKTTQIDNKEEICRYYKSSLGLLES